MQKTDALKILLDMNSNGYATNDAVDQNENPFTFTSHVHESMLAEGLRKQRDDGRFLDYVVEIGSLKIPVHKCVLVAFSEYFETLLQFEDRLNQDKQSHKLANLNPKSVFALIDFAYGGVISVDSEDVLDLLQAADYLFVTSVSEACCEHLINSLNRDNWFSVLEGALSLNNVKLITSARKYILENYTDFSASDDFLNLDSDTIFELLKGDKLVMIETFQYPTTSRRSTTSRRYFVPPDRQEDLILQSALRYVKYDPVNRAEHLPRILTHGVRLPLISTRVLNDYKRHDLLRDSSTCIKILDKAIAVSSTLVRQTNSRILDLITGINTEDDALQSLTSLVCPSVVAEKANEVPLFHGSASPAGKIRSSNEPVNNIVSSTVAVGSSSNEKDVSGSDEEATTFEVSDRWTIARDLASKIMSSLSSGVGFRVAIVS